MKKRLLSFTLAAAMVFSLAGCRSAEPAATEAPTTIAATTAAAEGGEAEAAEGEETEAPAVDFKIGIITGTASQGEMCIRDRYWCWPWCPWCIQAAALTSVFL